MDEDVLFCWGELFLEVGEPLSVKNLGLKIGQRLFSLDEGGMQLIEVELLGECDG